MIHFPDSYMKVIQVSDKSAVAAVCDHVICETVSFR